MKIRIGFNWHDRWIGSYDKIKNKKTISDYDERLRKQLFYSCDFISTVKRFHHYWICIIPCFPIHIWWEMKNVRCSKIGVQTAL